MRALVHQQYKRIYHAIAIVKCNKNLYPVEYLALFAQIFYRLVLRAEFLSC